MDACKLSSRRTVATRDCAVLPTPGIDGPYKLSDWRLSPLFDGESRRESDLDGGLAVIWFIALADGSRRLLPGNGVAFTGEFKLVRKETGYEKKPIPTGIGFAGYASGASRHHSTVSVTHRFL